MTELGVLQKIINTVSSKFANEDPYENINERRVDLDSHHIQYPSLELERLRNLYLAQMEVARQMRWAILRAERCTKKRRKSLKLEDKKTVIAQQNFYSQMFKEMLLGVQKGLAFQDCGHAFANDYKLPVFNQNLTRAVSLNFESNTDTYRIPISVCYDTKTISCGVFSSRRPHMEFVPENVYALKNEILEANGLIALQIREPHWDCPVFNKIFAEVLTPRFNKIFRLINYRVWVGDDEALVKRFCRVEATLTNGYVARFHRYRKLVLKANSNKEQQLIPAIMFFGADVGGLKKGLGCLWKDIYKNSPSRNHIIFTLLHRLTDHGPDSHHQCVSFTNDEKYIVRKNGFEENISKLALLQRLPTSILKKKGVFSNLQNSDQGRIESYLKAVVCASKILTLQKKLSHDDSVHSCIQLVVDTARMAANLQRPFSYAWSHRRMTREHRDLTLFYHKTVHDHFEYKFRYPWPLEINCGYGIKAALLTSNTMLFSEGEEMHHCVGSYHESVLFGESLIYSLTNLEHERSTLEIRFSNRAASTGPYRAQHKSKWNDDVSKEFENAASICVKAINDVSNKSHRGG